MFVFLVFPLPPLGLMKFLPFTKCCIVSTCYSFLPNLELTRHIHMMRKLVYFLCWGKKCRLQITCEFSCSSPLQIEQTPFFQKKNPKPTKTKPWKKHDAVNIPTEAEKQSFVGFEGVAQRLLMELVGHRRSACLHCRCWQPCGELGVCVQSRCAFRKSLNKGCGKRKKNLCVHSVCYNKAK